MLTRALLHYQLGRTMFREYDTDFNIQFFSDSGSIIDQNINFYAEDDAAVVNIWDEDDCIATLFRKENEWIVDRVDPSYAMYDSSIETDGFDDVMEFITRLEKILEMV
jgi:hypothetical protein